MPIRVALMSKISVQSVQTQSIKKTRPQNALNIAKTAPKIAPNNYSFLPTDEKFTSYSVPI